MTVAATSASPASCAASPPVDAPARVAEVARHRLAHVATSSIGTLSHGFRQRVGVAQAIIHEPKFLILDEPTRGLDPVQIVEMRNLIHDLKQNHTVLISSHILTEISQTCDRLLVLGQGKILGAGSEQELAARMGAGGTVEVEIASAAGRRVVDLASTVPGVTGATVVREADGVALVRMQAPADLRPEDRARAGQRRPRPAAHRPRRGPAGVDLPQLTKTHTGEPPQ